MILLKQYPSIVLYTQWTWIREKKKAESISTHSILLFEFSIPFALWRRLWGTRTQITVLTRNTEKLQKEVGRTFYLTLCIRLRCFEQGRILTVIHRSVSRCERCWNSENVCGIQDLEAQCNHSIASFRLCESIRLGLCDSKIQFDYIPYLQVFITFLIYFCTFHYFILIEIETLTNTKYFYRYWIFSIHHLRLVPALTGTQ